MMKIDGAILCFLATISLAAAAGISDMNGTARSAMPPGPALSGLALPGSAVLAAPALAAPALMPQQATAQLRIAPTAGGINWPNDGAMPILTYGWSGDRPRPVLLASDSSRLPFSEGDRPPILIVQRRDDIFSPLLREMLDQGLRAHSMALTVYTIGRANKGYTMWNVRVQGIRNVGAVIEENPVTQEIVFAFDSLSVGDLGR